MFRGNHFSEKLNKNIMLGLIAVALLYFIVCGMICSNIYKDFDFYKNAKHTSSIVKNIKVGENDKRTIRVAYIVESKTYVKDIDFDMGELGELEIGDTVSIFYNSKEPSDARITTKTLGSVYLTTGMLLIIGVIYVILVIYYYLRITVNNKLIEEDNYVMAKFSRLEFRNSFNPFVKDRVNCVYCKTKINGEKVVFKSMSFTEKPKPLNDTSMIKVYIDKNDVKKYLVNMDDLIENSK